MGTLLSAALLLFTISSGTVQADKPEPAIRIEKDVAYSKADGVDLRLDLARPAREPAAGTQFPLVVCLHGGAWQAGHRSAHQRTIELLARNGYVAATVSYRLAPKARWPAQIEDAKCAVRYLRSRARELKIDPERVAALGDSAGGHLALLLGFTERSDGLEGKGGHPKSSSKVQVVVNYYGPTDLRTWAPTPAGELMFRAWSKGKKGGDDLLLDLCGTSDRKAKVVAQLSPIRYLDGKDAAVLTLHGTEDPLVPVAQARTLHEQLRKAGLAEKLVLLEGKGHGWVGKDRDRTDRLVLEFLDARLKGNAGRSQP